MALLDVQHLTKRYQSFVLDNVSFSLEPGYIMGFIGRNGAGKTTTLKSIMNLVHPDSGTVYVLGQDFRQALIAVRRLVNSTTAQLNLGFIHPGVHHLLGNFRRALPLTG